MKKVTIKNMIENSEIPASLIRSAVKQFGGFESFRESAPDVSNHGIAGGFNGFIYYSDTCDFFKRNKEYIIDLAESQASAFGYKSLLEMVKDFNCIKNLDVSESEILQAVYQNKGDSVEQIQNCLAWYAGEEVCRLYNDLLEQED